MDTIDGMAGLLFAYFSLFALSDKYNLYLFWENKVPNMKISFNLKDVLSY